MNPNVSIVIPTFNRAKLVSRAIDTALAQTLPAEVVVCDHGSTDETPMVASSYGSTIKYIRREKDQGPIVCWRDGIENASGDFIHITYDDDWIDPTFVEKTLSYFHEDVGFVYTRVIIHFVETQTQEVSLVHPAGIRPMKQIAQHLLREPLTISPGCALFRRKDALKNLLKEIPGAKGRYGKNSGVGEDLLLFLLASLDYPRYGHVPEALSHFLAHPASITTDADKTGRLNALDDAYTVAKQYYLQQPNSIQRLRGIPEIASRAKWKIDSGVKYQFGRLGLNMTKTWARLKVGTGK